MNERLKRIGQTKQGKTKYQVELSLGEQVMIVKNGQFYKLGCQMGDVVHVDTLTEARHVTWNQYTQEWEES